MKNINNRNNPLRILCVFACLDRGGAETMCMNLYRHIDRSKVQFDFVKHTSLKGDFEDEIIALGGKIYEAPKYTISNHLSYRKWWSNHLREHPEHSLIHGHYFTLSSVYFSVAKKFGRICIGHSHCASSPQKNLRILVIRLFEHRVEKKSDYCLACSEAAGKFLFPNKPFTVLNNAINTKFFAYSSEVRNEVRESFGFTDNELILGTVGRISEEKNPFGIINIFASVKEKRPESKLFWVGDGVLRAEAEKKVDELGLTDSVVFTGVRSDVNKLLQAMDAFMLPSLYEGLPVTVIEAQASGIKCYLSDAITKESDITGRCVFLPISDPSLWADTILSDELDRVDARKYIENAGYDIDSTAKWLTDFYIEISD